MQTAMSKRKLRVGTQCTSLHCNVVTLMVSCGTLHVPAQTRAKGSHLALPSLSLLAPCGIHTLASRQLGPRASSTLAHKHCWSDQKTRIFIHNGSTCEWV
jgi:hypothetical protein